MTTTFIIYILHKMKLFKKQIRYIWYMECPTWLGRLIEKYAKKVNNRTDYSEWYKSYFFYTNEYFDRPKSDINFVESEARAKEIIDAKKFNKIQKEIDDNNMDVDIESMPLRIRELEKENEELKNLPPVEIEKIVTDHDVDIYPASDPRSKFHNDWKNSKIKKK